MIRMKNMKKGRMKNKVIAIKLPGHRRIREHQSDPLKPLEEANRLLYPCLPIMLEGHLCHKINLYHDLQYQLIPTQEGLLFRKCDSHKTDLLLELLQQPPVKV